MKSKLKHAVPVDGDKKSKSRFSLKSLLPKSRRERYLEMAEVINNYSNTYASAKSDYNNTYIEYDKDVSDKFFSFIINATKLKTINIFFDKNTININCSNYSTRRNNNSQKLNSDEIIEVQIDSIGFSVRKNYSNKIFYKDDKIYERTLPIISENYRELNRHLFMEVVDEFIVDSGLSRIMNLDKLTDDDK